MYASARMRSLPLVLVAGSSLLAQSASGSLSGQVKDASGKPAPGARVLIQSPALFSARTMVTDAKGEWRAFLLPTGHYRVQAMKEGFATGFAEGIRLGLGEALRQDLSLQSLQVSEAVVEVISHRVGMDKAETKAALNFSASDLEKLPTGAGGDRAFKGALSLAPGVVAETPTGRPSIRGGSTHSVQYRVNGADVKNDFTSEMGEDGAERWVVEDNIEDIQVILSPLHARFGQTQSGSVNIVTRTGGNAFKGSLRTAFTRDSWRALGPTDIPGATKRSNHLNATYQITLSGPLLKDRVWFSLATVATPQASATKQFEWWGSAAWQRSPWAAFYTGHPGLDAVTGARFGGTFDDPPPSPGYGVPAGFQYNRGDGATPFVQIQKNRYLETKLSGALAPDHVVEVAFMTAADEKTNDDPNDDVWNVQRIAALGVLKQARQNLGFTYRGILGPTLFLEGSFNQTRRDLDRPLGDPLYGAGQESVYSYGSGHDDGYPNDGFRPYPNWRGGMPFGTWVGPGTVTMKASTYNLNLKWLVESHELDLGLDGQGTDYMTDSYLNITQNGANNRQFNVGGIYSNAAGAFKFPAIRFTRLGDFNSVRDGYFPWDAGLAPTMVQYLGPRMARVKSNNVALYVNDLWTLNTHWNVMLGLRVEKQTLQDSTPRTLASATDLSPRFQLRYDLDGDSRRLVTFSAARFLGAFSQAFASAFAANAQSKAIFYGMTHFNHGAQALPLPGLAGDLQGGLEMYGVRFLDYADLVDPRNYTQTYRYADNSSMYQVDGSLKSPLMDELTLGYQHQFQKGSSLRFTYVDRTWKRSWAIAEDYNLASQVLIQDPSGTGLPPMYALSRRFFNSDALKRTYKSLETEWNVKTSAIWQWGGSWTYSRLTGNDEGGEDMTSFGNLRVNTPSPAFLDRAFLQSRGIPEATYAPEGRLGDDLAHRIRLHATATLPMGKGGSLSFACMASYTSGSAYGVQGAQALSSLGMTDLGADAHGTPYTSGSDRTIASYMGGRRPFEQNGTTRIDFRMAFRIPTGLVGTQVFGDLMIPNVFNTIRPGAYLVSLSGDASGLSSVGSDHGTPNWSDRRLYAAPRTITASLGVRF